MKKLLIPILALLVASPAWAAQQPQTVIPSQNSREALRTAVNTEIGKVHSNTAEIYNLAIAAPWLAQGTAPSIHNVFWVDTSGTSPVIKYWDGDSWEVAASGEGGTYTLPTASADTLGGIKVGARLTITDGVLSADVQSGGTYTSEIGQDMVCGMVTGNTETGITVTCDDADGTLDFVVNWAAPGAIGGTTPAAGAFTTLTADSFSANRTTSPQALDLYEGTGGGSNKVTIAPSAALAADKSIVAEAILQTTDASANGLSLIGAANYAAMRTLLDLEAGTDFYSISGMAASVYGQKEIGWFVVASDTVTAIADGKQAAVIPASMNGMNLVDLTCAVHDLNSAASGTTTVVLRRVRGATAVDMTSTGVTIDYNAYTASDETVDTSNDELATGDKLYIDVNAVTSAAQKGLSCTALFQTP